MKTKPCWICLETRPLTGEHKFKASDLRNEFGKDKMSKFVRGIGTGGFEEIQGVKSKKVKFDKSICANCNNSVTQKADYAYSDFTRMLPVSPEAVEDLYNIFKTKEFLDGTSQMCVELYRYFGKLLGCHIAENNLIVPEPLRSFVACENNNVCVYLKLHFDNFALSVSELLATNDDVSGYVGHGGLTVPCNRETHVPQSFLSSYTVGTICFEFWSEIKSKYLSENYYLNSELFLLTQGSLRRDGFIS